MQRRLAALSLQRIRSPLPGNSDKFSFHSDKDNSEFPGRGVGGEGIYASKIQLGVASRFAYLCLFVVKPYGPSR